MKPRRVGYRLVLSSPKKAFTSRPKSFLAAKEYQEYLTAEEQKQLEKQIAEANQAIIERQPVLEHIKKAQELLSQGQPVKARANYRKDSPKPLSYRTGTQTNRAGD